MGDSSRPNRSVGPRVLVVAGIVIALLAYLAATRRPRTDFTPDGPDSVPTVTSGPLGSAPQVAKPGVPRPANREPARDLVARRLQEFVRSRREIVDGYAASLGIPIPDEFHHLFTLAEADRWDELQALYATISERRQRGEFPEASIKLWPALLETYGVLEVTHAWPAQALLDYGNAVLGTLPSNAVYVGGTDAGRFIPTLLSETMDGEHPVVLTQNAFADLTYLDYARFVHGDRLPLLTEDDSREAFADYMKEAERRFQHDREHPGEPALLRPGEQVQVLDDGRIQAGGQVSVMAINELLMKTLMDRNPDIPFYMEESYPFQSLYGDASGSGPLIQLQGTPENTEGSPERAAQSVAYWQDAVQRLTADPDVAENENARTSWSKLVMAQAGMLEGQQQPAEAERLFVLALELTPTSPEGVFRYISLLQGQGRWKDALKIAQNALRQSPDNGPFQELTRQLQSKAGVSGTP